jgi:hypothetical protein
LYDCTISLPDLGEYFSNQKLRIHSLLDLENTQFKWNHSTVLSSCSHHYLLKFRRSTNYYIRRRIWRNIRWHNLEQKCCYSVFLYSKKFSYQYNLSSYFIFKTLLFSTSVFQLLNLRFLFKNSKTRLVFELYSFVLELCFCLTDVQNSFLCIFVLEVSCFCAWA